MPPHLIIPWDQVAINKYWYNDLAELVLLPVWWPACFTEGFIVLHTSADGPKWMGLQQWQQRGRCEGCQQAPGPFLEGRHLLSQWEFLTNTSLPCCTLVYVSRFCIKCGCQLNTRRKALSAHQYHLFIIFLYLEDCRSDPSAHLKKKQVAWFLLSAYATYHNI